MSSKLPECPICLSEYSRTLMPYLLPCGHALCQECFNSLKKRNTVECPQDRIKSNVKNLQLAYDLMSTIECLQDLKLQLNSESAVQIEKQLSFDSNKDKLEKEIQKKLKEFQEKVEKTIQENEEAKKRSLEQLNEKNALMMEKHMKNLDKKIRQRKIKINGFEPDQCTRERKNCRDDCRIYWSWQTSEHRWKEYESSISSRIESAYKSGESYAYIRLNNKNIRIDFDQWNETNGATRGPKIKRINTITSMAIWKYKKGYRNWIALPEPQCFELNQAWFLNKKQAIIKTMDEKQAVCDLNDMCVEIGDRKYPLMRDTI